MCKPFMFCGIAITPNFLDLRAKRQRAEFQALIVATKTQQTTDVLFLFPSYAAHGYSMSIAYRVIYLF